MNFTTVRALTFDFWNTLVSAPAGGDRRRTLRNQRLLEVASQCRTDLTLADVERAERAVVLDYERRRRIDYLGTSTDRLVRAIWDFLDVLPDGPTHVQVVEQFEKGILLAPPQPTDGVFDLLESLYGRYPLGLISDTLFSPGRVIRDYMQRIGMLRFFRYFVFSDETGVVKPHRNAFRLAASGLGAEPGSILHVGDLRVTDVAGARTHGFRAVQYAGVWHDPEPGPDPEALIEHWSALPPLLGNHR